MSRIYSLARFVVIWLNPGPGDDESSAISRVKTLSDGIEVFSMHEVAEECAAISARLRHPYWTRLRVLQEIVLAQRIFVLYGASTCTWDEFAKVEGRLLDYDWDHAPAYLVIKRRRGWKEHRHD
jgi:hypothetical protein